EAPVPGAPHRGPDPGRPPRHARASVRARLLGAAAASEGRRVGAGAVPDRGRARAALRGRAHRGAGRRLHHRGDRGVHPGWPPRQRPSGFGSRVHSGRTHTGASVWPSYDALLMKSVARGDSPEETIGRMARALGESRVEGVASNLEFLEHVIAHPAFATGAYTTKFVDETPELLESTPSPGGALGLLEFLGE